MPNSEYWISALEPESASVAPTVRMPLLVGMSSGKEALYTAWHSTHTQIYTRTKSNYKLKVMLHTSQSSFDCWGAASITPGDRKSTNEFNALF